MLHKQQITKHISPAAVIISDNITLFVHEYVYQSSLSVYVSSKFHMACGGQLII